MGLMERRALQVVLAILSLIPVVGLVIALTRGTAFFLPEGHAVVVDLDNQFRYLSGAYLAVSFGIWAAIPKIEERGLVLRVVALPVVVGALLRVVSILDVGLPNDPSMVGGVAFEGIVVPLVLLWQARIARRAGPSTPA